MARKKGFGSRYIELIQVTLQSTRDIGGIVIMKKDILRHKKHSGWYHSLGLLIKIELQSDRGDIYPGILIWDTSAFEFPLHTH